MPPSRRIKYRAEPLGVNKARCPGFIKPITPIPHYNEFPVVAGIANRLRAGRLMPNHRKAVLKAPRGQTFQRRRQETLGCTDKDKTPLRRQLQHRQRFDFRHRH